MRRLACLGGTLAVIMLVAPIAVEAPPQRIARIGVISLDFPNKATCVDNFRRGLHELGYVEGRTHVLELRWAEGRADLLPSLAADLVRMNVDLIVSASGPAAVIVKEATRSIPIVL